MVINKLSGNPRMTKLSYFSLDQGERVKRSIKRSTKRSTKRRMLKKKTYKYKKYRIKKGGEVIASGGYSCIFKPILSNIDYENCEFINSENGDSVEKSMNTKYQDAADKKIFIDSMIQGKQYISKLMDFDIVEHEFKRIDLVFELVRFIPNYKDYFGLDETVFMSKLTNTINQTDFQNIIKCEDPINKINADMNILKPLLEQTNISTIDFSKLAAIHMPYYGIDLETYLKTTEKTTEKFELIKGKLFELYKKAIQPMNANNLFHNDLKLSNLVIQEEDGDVKIRMINFGHSIETLDMLHGTRVNLDLNDPRLNKELCKQSENTDFVILYNKFLKSMNIENDKYELEQLDKLINPVEKRK